MRKEEEEEEREGGGEAGFICTPPPHETNIRCSPNQILGEAVAFYIALGRQAGTVLRNG